MVAGLMLIALSLGLLIRTFEASDILSCLRQSLASVAAVRDMLASTCHQKRDRSTPVAAIERNITGPSTRYYAGREHGTFYGSKASD